MWIMTRNRVTSASRDVISFVQRVVTTASSSTQISRGGGALDRFATIRDTCPRALKRPKSHSVNRVYVYVGI